MIWPILKPLFEDPSWRVKYACVLQISDICKSADKTNTKALILPYYAKFMVDRENELKMIAAQNLAVLVKYLEPEDIVNKITPLRVSEEKEELGLDISQHGEYL